MSSAARTKRVLLIDAVAWSTAYPPDHPRRNVQQWYARWFADLPNVSLERCPAEDERLVDRCQQADGVILSGSPRDAWNEDPVNTALCRAVRECGDRGIPFLGVCYGHQILARAFGGRVARHPDGLELGNTPVTLTDAGKVSPLLAGFPDRFDVLSSHADAVLEMPPAAELLIRGGFTRCQGLRCGPHLYGVQFHPETDPETLRFLWSVRRESWRSRVRFDLDQVLEDLQPAPVSANILRNFVIQIVS